MKKTIPELHSYLELIAKDIHDNAVKKGFWEKPVYLEQKLLLIISEICEAQDADRKRKTADLVAYHAAESAAKGQTKEAYEAHVKDSFEAEIAGTLIRCIDYCVYNKIDFKLIREFEPKQEFADSTDVSTQLFYLAGLVGLLNNAKTTNPSDILPRVIYFAFWLCWNRWSIDIVKFIHLEHEYNKQRPVKHGKAY